jgi:type IV pilus assembly protein PilM
MAKTAWGVELGTSSVKAVKLSGDRGGVSLEDVAIVGLAEFGLGAGTSHEDATAGALNELRTSKGIKKGDEVFVSISGQNTLGRIISLPPVAKERVRETIENEARSQIPIKLEEAVWDFQIIDDDDPDELRVNLYAAKKDVVEGIVNVCDNAGLLITGIQVAPLGIYNFIKYEMDDSVSDACVAIDIGADNTDVIIIDGQKTYVRVVPVAGNEITKALRARFKLSADDAEKLKRRAHKSKDAAAVFEAMKPPLKDMVGEIYRAVGFYKSQHEDANINQLVMMGNGSKLLNIKKFFEQQLQYQVHKVDTPVRVALSRSVDPTEVQNNIQSLTVAIGLALQGLDLDEVNSINLIPPEYLERQAAAKIRAPFYAAGAIAAAGGLIALLLAIFATTGAGSLTQQATSLKASVDAQNKSVTDLQPKQEDRDKAYSLINLTEGVVAQLPPPKPTEEDEEPGQPKALTLRTNAAPSVLLRASHGALAAYAGSANRPRTRIYFANFKSTVQGGLANASFMLDAVEEPAWVGEDAGEGGHYVNTRKYTLRVYIASELTSSIDQSDAHNALQSALTGKDGLLRRALVDSLVEEFKASGQLEGLKKAEIDAIKFDSGLSISVTQISNTQIVASGTPSLTNIVGTQGVTLTVPGWSAGLIRASNDKRFGVSEVTVILTLSPVQDAVEPEEEPTEE